MLKTSTGVDCMEIEYDLTVDDYVRFNQFHCDHSPTIRRIRLASMLLGPAAIWSVGFVVYSSRNDLSALVIFGVCGLLYLVAFPYFWRWTLRKRTRKLLAEGPVGEPNDHCSLRIDQDGLHATSRKGTASLNWSAVERIADSETDLYIYVGPTNAFVIPRRAFANPDDCALFASRARELREAAAGLTIGE